MKRRQKWGSVSMCDDVIPFVVVVCMVAGTIRRLAWCWFISRF